MYIFTNICIHVYVYIYIYIYVGKSSLVLCFVRGHVRHSLSLQRLHCRDVWMTHGVRDILIPLLEFVVFN